MSDLQDLPGALSFYVYLVRDTDKREHKRLSLATIHCKFGDAHGEAEKFKLANADVLNPKNVHTMFTFRQYIE